MPRFVQVGSFVSRRPGPGWLRVRRERVAAPLDRVWKALIEPEDLRRWWCREARVEAAPGGRHECRGLRWAPATPAESAEILRFEPPRLLELGAPLARRRFELEEELGETALRVEESGPEPAPHAGEPAAPDAWWAALPSLRRWLERGSDPLDLASALEPDGSLRLERGLTTFPWIIWRKLIDPGELRRWAAAQAEVEPIVGGAYRLGGSLLGELGLGPQRILELEPERRLALEWRWRPEGEDALGRVEWRIDEGEEATRVALIDRGPRAGAPADLALRWALRLLYLQDLSERGTTPLEYQA